MSVDTDGAQPTLFLSEIAGDHHPCRFQGRCSLCDWHWPKGGYVRYETVELKWRFHVCTTEEMR